jgi:hypothetical protein
MKRRNLESEHTSPGGRWLRLPLLLLALAALALGACAFPAPQRTEYEPSAADPEGLRRERNEAPHVVDLNPDARLDRYSEFVVDPFMVSYKIEHRHTGFAVSGSQPIRKLDPETEARLAASARDAFVKSIRRSLHFSLVEKPGPETLRIQGWIADLVVGDPEVPRPDLPICPSEMTLIATVRDAQTAQALARVAHRFAMRCRPQYIRAHRLDPLGWEDFARALRPAARVLRNHLDDLHELDRASGRAPARWPAVAASR